MYQPHKHKHRYVYNFVLQNHKSHGGHSFSKHEYTLCTDIDGPNCKENRRILETMLRVFYKHYPKTVKFSHEKHN